MPRRRECPASPIAVFERRPPEPPNNVRRSWRLLPTQLTVFQPDRKKSRSSHPSVRGFPKRVPLLKQNSSWGEVSFAPISLPASVDGQIATNRGAAQV